MGRDKKGGRENGSGSSRLTGGGPHCAQVGFSPKRGGEGKGGTGWAVAARLGRWCAVICEAL